MTLGARLRTLRKARGLTQRALAGEDLSGSFISMVEHDRVRPSLATLRLLAERLQEPLSALLADEGEHPLLLEAHLSHGDALLVRHEFTRAVEEYQAALRGAERLADPRLGTRAHLGLAQALTGLHHFDLAEPHLAAADEGAAALGDALLAAQAANARGIMELRRRDFPAARRALQRALDHLRSAPAEDRALTERILSGLEIQARRMARLTDDLVTIDRLEAGRLRLQVRPVDLGRLVWEVGEQFLAEARFRGLELVVERPDVPAVVETDPDRLAQAYANLVSNALKYTPPDGQVRLWVRREAMPRGGDGYRLAVTDSGPGIPPEELDRIFDRYYRGAAAGNARGSGLGLAIVRDIAEALGATVSVESDPGSGTTFSLWVRAAVAAAPSPRPVPRLTGHRP